jgi:transcriptional regulator with XRE-family HTH domain
MDDLSDRIKISAQCRGLKCKDLARLIGVTPSALCRALSRQSKTWKHLQSAAEILGVDEDWLRNGSQPPAATCEPTPVDAMILAELRGIHATLIAIASRVGTGP